jgi:hypothetical protein
MDEGVMRASLSALLRHVSRTAAMFMPPPLCRPLRTARSELGRRLNLAFRLASTYHRTVVLEPFRQTAKGRISLHLPEGVCWGRPMAVPLPPNLIGSGWRDDLPRPITVMPQYRASANVWFLHHGQETLCLRLHASGTVELLRYRPLLGTWVDC